jgi:hypothetical protein
LPFDEKGDLNMVFANRRRNLAGFVLIILACGMFPQAAGASWVGDDILQVQVQSQGLTASQTWLLPQGLTSSGQGCQYYQYDVSQPVDFVSSGGVVLGTLDMASALYRSDPFVALGVAVTAGAADTTFTITSATVSFDPITNPQAFAVASLTLTDNNGDGATFTGLYPGGKSYQAIYTSSGGQTTWTSLLGGFTASPDGTNTLSDGQPATGTQLISDTLVSIQSQFDFTLSPYDSASGTSHFEITPEPATLSLLVLGGLAILRRSRK